MCIDPPTLVILQSAMAAGSMVMGYVGQQQAAESQEAAARDAHTAAMGQLQEQRLQTNINASQEMSERGKQALFERGRLRAASIEGGAMGNSIDRIMDTNEFNLGQDLAMMQVNNRNAQAQSSAEGVALAAQTQSRLNAIERPSLFNTGLQIAGISLNGYERYKKVS